MLQPKAKYNLPHSKSKNLKLIPVLFGSCMCAFVWSSTANKFHSPVWVDETRLENYGILWEFFCL